MATLAMTEPAPLPQAPSRDLDLVDAASSPRSLDFQPSRDLDLLTCSVEDIVNHFAQTWRDIADATQHHLAILAKNPCDLDRARAVRTLACGGRILRMVECARIRLYRLAHPGERIPRAALRGNSAIRDELAQSGREARQLRKVGRAHEQEQKATRRTKARSSAYGVAQPPSAVNPTASPLCNRLHPPKVQSTGFSLPTLPHQKDSTLSTAHTPSPSEVQSPGFSPQPHPHPESSAPSAKTTGSSSNRESSVGNRKSSNPQSAIPNPKSSIAQHVLDLLEHPPSLTDPSIRKHLTDKSLLHKYIDPPVATPFVQTLIDAQSAIRNPQSAIQNPQSPIGRAERRRRERLRRKGRPAPS